MGYTYPGTPGSLRHIVPPLDQECPALRRAGPHLRGRGPAAADVEGTQVPEGRQQRGHPVWPHALAPMVARGPLQRGNRAVPLSEGLVERGPGHCQAVGDPLQRGWHPPAVRSRSRLVEEATHEDVLQAEVASEQPP